MHRGLIRLVGSLVLGLPCAAQIEISEFAAVNRDTLTDRDGLSSDWLELHNAGDVSVNLAGHGLSDDADDLAQWRFPSVEIAPRGYVLVYLSGKDRARPDEPLHANFRLASTEGELFLTGPDGQTILNQVAFGQQRRDVSQGFQQPVEEVVLLAPDAPGRFMVPDETTPLEWMQPGFDDSGWTEATGAFGFERSKERIFSAELGTDVGAVMRGTRASAYYRLPFEVDDPDAFDLCVLRIRFESGFVAYLNGREIARRRAPSELGFAAQADVGLEPRDPQRSEYFELRDFRSLLQPGGNVLAVHGLIESANSLEHLVLAEILAYRAEALETGRLVFFPAPTPGRPNGYGFERAASLPVVHSESVLFQDETQVTIDLGDAEDDGSVLHYTLDGSEPTRSSPIYAEPIVLTTTTELRVKAYLEGAMPSETVTTGFVELDPELSEFSSDLPLVAVSTFGQAVRPKDFVDSYVHVVSGNKESRSSLLASPDFSGHGAIKMRGSSTMDRPKKSYGLELRDQYGDDFAASIGGLPADSDWVLYGPHNWDQSHIRNALFLTLGSWVGLDAPRTRFVEVFLNTERRALRREDYIGLYVLTERISRGRHRVDVEELKPKHNREPALSGGYILKIDRPGPGDMGFDAGGQRLQFVYPKEREVTDPQRDWLVAHFQSFGDALGGTHFDDADFGYQSWIYVDNFIDYHLYNEYTKNPDAFTLSTYLYKKRGDKIRMGPVWDYDRAMRTNDDEYWVGRPGRPTGWTNDRLYSWWGKLFADEAFERRYRARGRAMLAGELRVDLVLAEVDRMAAEIEEAEERDRQRWPIITPGQWYDEIIELKDFVRARDQWMRSELIEKPVFTTSTGNLVPPCTLEMSHENGDGVIYYTLDGSDPTLMDGGVSPRAIEYTEPIEISGRARARARVLANNVWSVQTDRMFLHPLPTLSISELMYNPESGGDYEFIEFLNYGDEPIDLRGIEIDGGLRFHFSVGDVHTLLPGERVVVVRDVHEFADRYDITQMQLAGEYHGRFSNTEAQFRILGPLGELLGSAYYSDAWFPQTDGRGFSLVPVEPDPHLLEREQWMQSRERGGTPGH